MPSPPEFQKIEALLAMGRAQDAASLADQLPEREHPSAEFCRLRGRALRASGRVFDAEAAFREGLALSPQDPVLLADLATTLLGQKRQKEALSYAREAVALRPEVAAFHCLIGVLAESQDLDQEAIRALQTACQLSPNDPEPPALLGYLYLRNEQPDKAEECFFAALAINPQGAESLRGLARVRLQKQQWEAARRYWLEALQIQPALRDRALERILWVGHPLISPLLLLAQLSPWVSIGLFLLLQLLIFTGLLSQPTGLILLCLIAIPSLVRVLLNRQLRQAVEPHV